MEERTFIRGISELIDNVGKCKCYDDARNLLNSFVIENIGKKYETEDGSAYRNSNNTKDIKRETLATMENTLYRWELIDEASDETLNEAIKYHDLRGGGAVKSNFVDLRVKRKVVKQYVEAWRKEAAPIIKKKDTVRLRPKLGAEKYIEPMFLHLKELSIIDEQTIIAPWLYLCGFTDEEPEIRIKWTGGLFYLNVLIERFLLKNSYFKVSQIKGATSFICSLMVDENGNEIKPSSLKTTKNREFGKNPKRVDEVWQSMKLTGIL